MHRYDDVYATYNLLGLKPAAVRYTEINCYKLARPNASAWRMSVLIAQNIYMLLNGLLSFH